MGGQSKLVPTLYPIHEIYRLLDMAQKVRPDLNSQSEDKYPPAIPLPPQDINNEHSLKDILHILYMLLSHFSYVTCSATEGPENYQLMLFHQLE